jgi:asparagine synthase (glutamine-hydrolysing)
MGALWMLIYANSTPEPITQSFYNKFLSTSNRGPSYSDIVTQSTVNIFKNDSVKMLAKNILDRHTFMTYVRHHFIFGFHRLSTSDQSLNAIQPLRSSNGNSLLMCNGELYNYNELVDTFNIIGLTSFSDVEVILPLYIQFGPTRISELLDSLRGEFSLVISDNIETFNLNTLSVFAATDLLSTKSLYLLYNTSFKLYMIFTELKNIPMHLLNNNTYTLLQFPPASYWSFHSPTTFSSYFDFSIYQNLNTLTYRTSTPETLDILYPQLRTIISNSIIEKFTFGHDGYSAILLSGGFDSSLVLSIIVKYLYDNDNLELLDNVHIFTVGDCDECDDVVYAQELIAHLDDKYNISLQHHIVFISDIDCIVSKLKDIVYIVESFDTDVIISSVFFYFLYTHINNNKSTLGNFKSIITGDGLDEYCGYDSLLNLEPQAFQNTSIELIKHLCKSDIVKTDKLAGYHGYEVRYPYLDKNVVDLLLNIHPNLKKKIKFDTSELPIDKYIIRKAFDLNNTYLPSNILWRTRQNISDNLIIDIRQDLETYYNNIYSTDELYSFTSSLEQQPTTPQTCLDMHLYNLFTLQFSQRTSIIEKRHSCSC